MTLLDSYAVEPSEDRFLYDETFRHLSSREKFMNLVWRHILVLEGNTNTFCLLFFGGPLGFWVPKWSLFSLCLYQHMLFLCLVRCDQCDPLGLCGLTQHDWNIPRVSFHCPCIPLPPSFFLSERRHFDGPIHFSSGFHCRQENMIPSVEQLCVKGNHKPRNI